MKLFIFGSTGDLVKRKVLPALQGLAEENSEFKGLEIWALGRKDFTHEVYKDFVCEGGKCSLDFRKRIFYKRISLENSNMCEGCLEIFDKKETNYLYISLPPEFIKNILESSVSLKKAGIKIRLLIEKPFGRNLEESEELESFIEKNFHPDEVYLSDHYLFKDGILEAEEKIPDFRNLKIVSLEEVGLESRMTYYDGIGALKDMVQSHFLNIAFRLGGKINPDGMKIARFRKMQYGNGKDSGYVSELGKSSRTETFVDLAITAEGREFEFITGKAFDKKVSFIELDGRKISLEDRKNPYERMFSDFFAGRKSDFPKVKNAVLAWKIINRIEDSSPELQFYLKGISSDEFLKRIK